jgi:hypothetical protein
MPRKPRCSRAGRVYHLISRFVDREWFIKDDEDRAYYLKLVGRALKRTDWRAFGYSIMSNHFHHSVLAGKAPLGEWIRRVHAPFAGWLNKKYDRIGSVFVRGPKQLEVRTDGVASLLAYIHNNPVRAGLVPHAALSEWSSHRAYVGLDRAPRWLCVEEGLELAGVDDVHTFDEYVRRRASDRRHDLARDRRVIEKPEEYLEFHHPPEPPVVSAAQIVVATADVLGIERTVFMSRRRSPLHVLARHVACYAAERLHVSGASIAPVVGLSQQGVSFILKRSPDAQTSELANAVAASVVDSLQAA